MREDDGNRFGDQITMIMITRSLALLLTCSILFTGCSQQQVDQRIKEYEIVLNPLIDRATKEDMVKRYGMPQDRQTVGILEVWTYHFSFGSRGSAYISNPNQFGAMAATNSREIYDRLTLTFNKRGVLEYWRVWVQR